MIGYWDCSTFRRSSHQPQAQTSISLEVSVIINQIFCVYCQQFDCCSVVTIVIFFTFFTIICNRAVVAQVEIEAVNLQPQTKQKANQDPKIPTESRDGCAAPKLQMYTPSE